MFVTYGVDLGVAASFGETNCLKVCAYAILIGLWAVDQQVSQFSLGKDNPLVGRFGLVGDCR